MIYKRYCVAMIMFFIPLSNGFCQDSPLKFVSNQNIWQMYNNQFGTSKAAYYQLSFKKDRVLIDGNYYHEQILDHPENPGWKGSNQFFREENSKVYIRNNGNDKLYYDFTLNVGDSIVNNQPNGKLILTRIETIETEDGIKRKRFKFAKHCSGTLINNVTWIEGIGDITTRFPQYNNCIIVDPEPRFNCFLRENEVVFSSNCCKDPEAYKKILDGHIWQVDVSYLALPGIESRLLSFSNIKSSYNNKDFYQLLKADKPIGNVVSWKPTNRYFREENKQLIEWRSSIEEVHFDFNLNVGDTFKFLKVLRVDTVLLEDQKPRKRLFFECYHSGNEDVTWVEGVGDIDFFLDSEFFCSVADPPENMKLRCYFQSNYIRLYEANWSSGCISVGTKEESKTEQVRLYPNPASSVVNLKFEKSITGKIVLRNQLGQDVSYHSFHNQYEIQLKTDHLNPGIYFITTYVQNGSITSKKLIIE